MELFKFKATTALTFLLLIYCFIYQWRQPLTVEEVALKSLPSVVEVISSLSRTNVSLSAGAVISRHGHIITTAHGIHGKIVVVKFHNHLLEYKAVVVAISTTSDIAILQVPNMPEDVPVLRISKVYEYNLGSTVIVIGHPEGFLWCVSAGVISKDMNHSPHQVLITAAVNPGNSGGPVLNTKGEIIGIVQAYCTTQDGRRQRAEGMNLAIPSQSLIDFIGSIL